MKLPAKLDLVATIAAELKAAAAMTTDERQEKYGTEGVKLLLRRLDAVSGEVCEAPEWLATDPQVLTYDRKATERLRRTLASDLAEDR